MKYFNFPTLVIILWLCRTYTLYGEEKAESKGITLEVLAQRLNQADPADRNATIREIAQRGTPEAIAFLQTRLEHNLNQHKGNTTSTGCHSVKEFRVHMIVPSENEVLAEELAKTYLEKLIPLLKRTALQGTDDGAHLAQRVYESYGQIIPYNKQGETIAYEPSDRQKKHQQLRIDFEAQWHEIFKNLNPEKKALGLPVNEWLSRYKMPFNLTHRTNDGSTVQYYRERYSKDEIETFTLYGDLNALNDHKKFTQILWRSDTGTGQTGFWAYFDAQDGELLFLFHMDWAHADRISQKTF
ncbi:hypothetical protein P0Y35_14210 [Kiritimatiellaeota bacterium B1221]|nr:hypothetical protein [Kiritimatiellaeota bacterium B1221]